MTEREVMAELVRFVGVLTYGKEHWFKQNGCWYNRMFGDYIQNEVLLERITEAINDEIADRPTVDKEYLIDLIQEAVYDGEACAKLIDLVDRPTGEWIYAKEQLEIVPMWECSCCKIRMPKKFNYCPNCGAYMKGNEL